MSHQKHTANPRAQIQTVPAKLRDPSNILACAPLPILSNTEREAIKMIKTLYVPIYRKERIVHLATVRSDWKQSTYDLLAEDFPGCHVKSASLSCALIWLGKKWHNTDFRGMVKFSTSGILHRSSRR